MPINFAALVPHPPIAIPAVGKDKIDLVSDTINSIKKLTAQIYQSKIDTIILISEHGQVLDNAFSINHSPELQIDLSSFGDLTNYPALKNNIGLAYQIRECAETKLPLSLYNSQKLDYGSSVPMFYIMQVLPKIKIIPINTTKLNYDKHLQFGELIKEICFRSSERVAIIASADLSHKLSDISEAGFSEKGKEFDSFIIKNLKNKKINQLINISPDLVKEASTCGLRSLMVLLGIIKNMNYNPNILSYEYPIGIGYLTVNFEIN